MFIDNKYTTWYNNIVNSAMSENRVKSKKDNQDWTYYEKHHIIPKSIGGSDDPANLILLTAKEHFICHMLLTKMFTEKEFIHKMNFAFNMMSNFNDKCHSNFYKKNKIKVYELVSAKMSGVPKSKESLIKMVETRKRNGSYHHTEEAKNKMKASSKNRSAQTAETKAKRRNSMKGKKQSAEHIAALSKVRKGRVPWNKGISTGPISHIRTEETRNKLSKANKKPKRMCCCLDCNREISINNLDKHQASRSCKRAI